MYYTPMPVSAITPETKRWTAKVLVIQRLSPRQSRSSTKKYQKLVLIDKDENKVQAIVYSPDISMLENTLHLQETYLVANAKVAYVDPIYRMVPNVYQWVINKTTVVRPVIHDSLPRELGEPTFTKVSDIEMLNTNTLIDIMGIVIDKTEKKPINTRYGPATVQDFYVIDDNRAPMLLTLWNEVLFSEGETILAATDRMPIIAALRVAVVNYRGKSLTGKGFANIILNPSYPEAQSLRNWRARNHTYLTEITEEKKYLDRPPRRLTTTVEDSTPLVDIIASQDVSKIYLATKVSAQILAPDQTFWYMACGSCLKTTSAGHLWIFPCHYCGAEAVATPRTKFTITISDSTTQLEATLFGGVGERVLGLTATEMLEKDVANQRIDCNAINISLENQQFNVELRKRPVETMLGNNYQYTVINLQKIEDPAVGHDILETLSTYPDIAGSSTLEQDTGPSGSTSLR